MARTEHCQGNNATKYKSNYHYLFCGSHLMSRYRKINFLIFIFLFQGKNSFFCFLFLFPKEKKYIICMFPRDNKSFLFDCWLATQISKYDFPAFDKKKLMISFNLLVMQLLAR